MVRYPKPSPAAAVLASKKGKRYPVLHPSGELYYLASIEHLQILIESGEARPFGPGNRIDGCIIASSSTTDAPVGGQSYVHEVLVKWENTRGDGQAYIYQFKWIGQDRRLFQAPLIDAGAPLRPALNPTCIARKKRRGRKAATAA